jgi:hypothetical protein
MQTSRRVVAAVRQAKSPTRFVRKFTAEDF